VLQYVAASFHLPSEIIVKNNTVQYPKPCKQCEIPTIPAAVIAKVLLLQSNIMAAFVPSNSNLFSDVSPALPTHSNHNLNLFTTTRVTIDAVVVVVVHVALVVVN